MQTEPYHRKQGKSNTIGRQFLALLDGCHAPAVLRLVHHAGIQCHTVIRGGGGAAGIVDADLLHAGNGIGAGPQQGGQGDGIARLQGVDLAEVVIHPPVVVE